MRMLIFGFSRGTDSQEVRALLGACGEVPLDMVDLPGDNDDAYAVVHLIPNSGLAWRLAQGINARRFHGRRLQSWVPVMAWS